MLVKNLLSKNLGRRVLKRDVTDKIIPVPPDILAQEIGIGNKRYQGLVLDYPELADLKSGHMIGLLYSFFKSCFILKSNINEVRNIVVDYHPWFLLFQQRFVTSRLRWHHMTFSNQYSPQEVKNVLPLVFSFPLEKSKAYLKMYHRTCMDQLLFLNEWQDRLTYLSDQLEITRFEVISIAKTIHPVIMTRDFETIKNIMSLLKENGMTAADILNDLHIFRHNLDVMQNRILELKSSNALFSLKTWMLRAPEKTIKTSFAIRADEANIVGKDRIAFLSERLGVKREEVERVVSKNPHILGVRAKKLDSLLSLLTGLGYSGWEILHCPRCFQYSLDLLSKRHHELNLICKKPDLLRLSTLSLDRRKYLGFLKRLKERDI